MAVILYYDILQEDGFRIALEDSGFMLQEETGIGPDPPVEPLFFGIMQGPVAQSDIYERLNDDDDLLIILGG